MLDHACEILPDSSILVLFHVVAVPLDTIWQVLEVKYLSFSRGDVDVFVIFHWFSFSSIIFGFC